MAIKGAVLGDGNIGRDAFSNALCTYPYEQVFD